MMDIEYDGYHKVKLPINVAININIDDIWKIGYSCGVYVLITRSGRTYIGSSTNLRGRISNHRSNIEYIFDRIESVIIYATANIKDAKDLEIILIKEIKPDLNRIRYVGTIYGAKDVIKNLFRHSIN